MGLVVCSVIGEYRTLFPVYETCTSKYLNLMRMPHLRAIHKLETLRRFDVIFLALIEPQQM